MASPPASPLASPGDNLRVALCQPRCGPDPDENVERAVARIDEGPAIDTAQHDAWETVQRGHAIADGLFVVSVNRVGEEDGIRFWGQSFVADPFGRVLGRAASGDEEALVADCDLTLVERIRRDWPFLRDRPIDAYRDLTRRTRD